MPEHIRPVPPGSTPLRELAHAVDRVLTLPNAAAARDEVTYLRITRDRARLVRLAMRRIATGRELEDRDVMITVTNLLDQAGQLGDDDPAHEPDPSP